MLVNKYNITFTSLKDDTFVVEGVTASNQIQAVIQTLQKVSTPAGLIFAMGDNALVLPPSALGPIHIEYIGPAILASSDSIIVPTLVPPEDVNEKET